MKLPLTFGKVIDRSISQIAQVYEFQGFFDGPTVLTVRLPLPPGAVGGTPEDDEVAHAQAARGQGLLSEPA